MFRQAIGRSVRRGVAFSCALAEGLTLAGYAVAEPHCAANRGAVAADLSQPVDDAFLAKMRQIGVKTIIRYYDHPNETIENKTLHRAERDLITSKGFSIGVVFQHHNDCPTKFKAWTGHQDARRALELAKENGQPRGSAIYFAVDFDARAGLCGRERDNIRQNMRNVRAYFGALAAEFAGKKYRIGAYGSGAVCNRLMEEGLATLCWISQSQDFPGTREALARGSYHLRQLAPSEHCGGKGVDFNLANEPNANFGQFRAYEAN
jgi:hypothetical protein